MAIDKAEQQAFLAAIREDWENDTPRLVYADWLEENGGQSEKARAEFIRVQVALAAGHDGFSNLTEKQRSAYQERERELLTAHRHNWEEELQRELNLLHFASEYRRGILTGLDLRYTLADSESLGHLASHTQLEKLNLRGTKITDGGLALLKPLTRLRMLTLDFTHVTDGGLVHLAPFTNLQRLSLRDTLITDGGLVHLAPFTNLQRLNLWGTEITLTGLTPFVANPAMPENLQIRLPRGNTLTVAALREQAGIPQPVAEPHTVAAEPGIIGRVSNCTGGR